MLVLAHKHVGAEVAVLLEVVEALLHVVHVQVKVLECFEVFEHHFIHIILILKPNQTPPLGLKHLIHNLHR